MSSCLHLFVSIHCNSVFLFSFRLAIIIYNLISSKFFLRTQKYKCNNIIIQTAESVKWSKTIQRVQKVKWNKTIHKSQSIKWNNTIQTSQSVKWNTTIRTVQPIKWNRQFGRCSPYRGTKQFRHCSPSSETIQTLQSIKWNNNSNTAVHQVEQTIRTKQFTHHSPSSEKKKQLGRYGPSSETKFRHAVHQVKQNNSDIAVKWNKMQTFQYIKWNKTIRKMQSIKWNKTIQTSQSIKWTKTIHTSQSIKWNKTVQTSQSNKWNKTIRKMQSIKWNKKFRRRSPSCEEKNIGWCSPWTETNNSFRTYSSSYLFLPRIGSNGLVVLPYSSSLHGHGRLRPSFISTFFNVASFHSSFLRVFHSKRQQICEVPRQDIIRYHQFRGNNFFKKNATLSCTFHCTLHAMSAVRHHHSGYVAIKLADFLSTHYLWSSTWHTDWLLCLLCKAK